MTAPWLSSSFLQRKLGEFLLESGLISETDLKNALDEALRQEKRLGYVLVKQGKISTEDLGEALSNQHKVRYIHLAAIDWDAQLLSLLPQEFMRIKQLLPVRRERGKLVIAAVDPTDQTVQDEITFMTGIRPDICVTTAYEFEQFAKQLLGKDTAHSLLDDMASLSGFSQEAQKSVPSTLMADTHPLPSNVLPFPTIDTVPVVALINDILHHAIDHNASDIHFEPRQDRLVVRFRMDGLLKTWSEIPQSVELMVLTRLKVMARLDITQQHQSQDGRMTFAHKGSTYHFRINTLPIKQHREKIAIRLLRPFNQIEDFPELGFEPQEIRQLQRLYQSPAGIVLVCGPTGSGKTTTLYTILNQLNTEERNICAVEDPIELEIEGINQTQIDETAGITFSRSVHNLLRQDPDILMIGEIRDLDTLHAATEAALSGQLVLSTIHSQNSSTAIQRMIELGLPTHLIASCLTGILAQRLVRKLCLYCRQAYEATPEEKAYLFSYDHRRQEETLLLFRSRGCNNCNHTGYDGRTGLFEIMTVDREIQHLIQEGNSDIQIEEAAVSSGMQNLMASGRKKVINGEISVDELVRVLGIRG